MAVIKPDLEKETNDLWVIDVASGRGRQITTSKAREGANSPAWSPDGRFVAYVALRDGYFGLYRKPSNGEGAEELLYKNSAPMTLTDWSQDGSYLTYFSTDLSGGGLYAVPVNAEGERKAIEVSRTKSQMQGPRLSPDSRLMAYTSNASGRIEVYVLPFDPKAAARHGTGGRDRGRSPTRAAPAWCSGAGMGRNCTTLRPTEASWPSRLRGPRRPHVRQAEGIVPSKSDIIPGVAPGTTSISRNGERFVIAVPRPQLRQIHRVRPHRKGAQQGGRAWFLQPGEHVARRHARVFMRNDPKTGNGDIWTIDLTTGKGTPVTNDTPPENAPIWSPDGKHVAYVSTRESLSGIYRKPADGSGQEELLFQYTPGRGMVLTDWSPDGKFMAFYTGVLVLVPLDANKKPAGPQGDRLAAGRLRRDAGPILSGQHVRRLLVERGGCRQGRRLRASVQSEQAGRARRTGHQGVEGWRHRHDHVAARRQRAVLHDAHLGRDGDRRDHHADVQGR